MLIKYKKYITSTSRLMFLEKKLVEKKVFNAFKPHYTNLKQSHSWQESFPHLKKEREKPTHFKTEQNAS
jgi:hypothetical protein